MDSITEQGVEYALLSADDYEQVERAVREEKVAYFKRIMDESKIGPADRFVALRDARVETVRLAEVRDYITSSAGAKKVCVLALVKKGMTADDAAAVAGKLRPLERMELALRLANFEDARPLSPAPSTSTGNPTSTSSPTAPEAPHLSGSTTASA